MTNAFVETTIITNLLLKKDGSEQRAKALLDQYSEVIIPEFSWKEFKRGPLMHFRWLHNKLNDTKSLTATFLAYQKLTSGFKPYMVSTAAQALHTGSTYLSSMTTVDLQNKYGTLATIDAIQADIIRLRIKEVICDAWDARSSLGCKHPLSCYENIDITFDKKGNVVLTPTDCPLRLDCCLRQQVVGRKDDLGKIKSALNLCPVKKETTDRRKILKQLIKRPRTEMDRNQCRSFGDAYFALFCPADTEIVTTNVKDIVPLAESLGIKVRSP